MACAMKRQIFAMLPAKTLQWRCRIYPQSVSLTCLAAAVGEFKLSDGFSVLRREPKYDIARAGAGRHDEALSCGRFRNGLRLTFFRTAI
jgi:hypothetical protein